jgi:hypothetical protein
MGEHSLEKIAVATGVGPGLGPAGAHAPGGEEDSRRVQGGSHRVLPGCDALTGGPRTCMPHETRARGRADRRLPG